MSPRVKPKHVCEMCHGNHKLRMVDTNWGSPFYRVLTIPVFWTDNVEKVDKSKFQYGGLRRGGFELRVSGILHGWFGVTMNLPTEGPKAERYLAKYKKKYGPPDV